MRLSVLTAIGCVPACLSLLAFGPLIEKAMADDIGGIGIRIEFPRIKWPNLGESCHLPDNYASESKAIRIRALIQQMAPVMVMHPKEGDFCCYPSDPAKFFDDEALVVRGLNRELWNPAIRRWIPATPANISELRGALGRSVADLPFNSEEAGISSLLTKRLKETPKTFSENAPCYVEHWAEGDLLQVRYWFWWKYNDHPRDTLLHFGSHEGDWEHVELRARWTSRTNFRVTYYLSGHGKARNTNGVRWTSTTPMGGPHFYVSLGGHAIYERPGSYNTGAAGLFEPLGYGQDRASESDQRWRTGEHLVFKEDLEQNHPVFAFRGAWGVPGGPPTKDQWKNAAKDDFPVESWPLNLKLNFKIDP